MLDYRSVFANGWMIHKWISWFLKNLVLRLAQVLFFLRKGGNDRAEPKTSKYPHQLMLDPENPEKSHKVGPYQL